MSKFDKNMGLPKPADEKRKDPPHPIHFGKKTKKKYPPHFRISSHIFPSKVLKEQDWSYTPSKDYPNCLEFSPDWYRIKEFFRLKRLDEALAIYAKHHPETANWPVRFIGIQPMETKREVLI